MLRGQESIVSVAESREKLPEWILEKINENNVFYSEIYAEYEKTNKSRVVYIYDDDFVQVVALHRIHGIFRTAVFLAEPVCLGEFNAESLKAFLNAAVDWLDKIEKIDWISVTPASSLFRTYPDRSERIKFGNYIIDLSLSEDELFKKVTSKHRNMIRRGEKSRIEIRFGGVELLPDYMIVDKQTWERNGKTIDNTSFYKNYISSMNDNVVVGMAYHEDVPQCGLIGLYNKAMFYYMFGASADRPEPGSTHYLQWRTIQKMKKSGVKYYNFVGCRINVDSDSKYHNIQHFKKGFGGTLEECFLFRSILHPKQKNLFDKLLKMRSGNQPNDVIDQEISKWSDIN